MRHDKIKAEKNVTKLKPLKHLPTHFKTIYTSQADYLFTYSIKYQRLLS